MTTYALLLLRLISLWGTYSIICCIYPIKPFSSRGKAFRSVLLSLGAMLILATGMATAVGPQRSPERPSDPSVKPVSSSDSSAAVAANIALRPGVAAPCGNGGVALGDLVRVKGAFSLRTLPSETSPKVKNEKASLVLGHGQFYDVDGTTIVRRLCVQSDWTQVQIAYPDWLKDVSGWIENEALLEIPHSPDGARIYTEQDIYWQPDTAPFKRQIVPMINRIARENKNCSTIDTGSVTKDDRRSRPHDPVFFVTCNMDSDPFNVWFRPGEGNKQTFKAIEPLAEPLAVDACEKVAMAKASHPSTVSFSRVWDLAYMPHASGRATVISSFTAKNDFNLELKFRISCLFDGPTLIETKISESRN